MKQLLIDTITAAGYLCILQGSMSPDEPYPSEFVTFFTLSSDPAASFDNALHSTAWSYQVTYYSDDPAKVQTAPGTIRAALIAAGFIPQGKGRDIPSDVPTYTGWTCEYYYLETED